MPDTPDPAILRDQIPQNSSVATSRSAWRTTIGLILIDAVPPLAIFFILNGFGVAAVVAYTAGAAVPAVRLIIDLLRGKPFNAISALVGVFLLVSIILAVTTADVRAVMARGAVIYLALALVFAGSLLIGRPLVFVIMRYHAVRLDPRIGQIFDQRFATNTVFRHAVRTTTGVYSVVFMATAVACAIAAYTLPVPVAATVTGLLELLASLVVVAWSIRYLRRSQQHPTANSTTGTGS